MASTIDTENVLVEIDMELEDNIDSKKPENSPRSEEKKSEKYIDIILQKEPLKILLGFFTGIMGIIIFIIGLIIVNNYCIYNGALILEGIAYIALGMCIILCNFSNDFDQFGQLILFMTIIGNIILNIMLIIYILSSDCQTNSVTYIVGLCSFICVIIIALIYIGIHNMNIIKTRETNKIRETNNNQIDCNSFQRRLNCTRYFFGICNIIAYIFIIVTSSLYVRHSCLSGYKIGILSLSDVLVITGTLLLLVEIFLVCNAKIKNRIIDPLGQGMTCRDIIIMVIIEFWCVLSMVILFANSNCKSTGLYNIGLFALLYTIIYSWVFRIFIYVCLCVYQSNS